MMTKGHQMHISIRIEAGIKVDKLEARRRSKQSFAEWDIIRKDKEDRLNKFSSEEIDSFSIVRER